MSYVYENLKTVFADASRASAFDSFLGSRAVERYNGYDIGTARFVATLNKYPFRNTQTGGIEWSETLKDELGYYWRRITTKDTASGGAIDGSRFDNPGYRKDELYDLRVRIRGVYLHQPYEIAEWRRTIFGGADLIGTTIAGTSKAPVVCTAPQSTTDPSAPPEGVYLKGSDYQLRASYISGTALSVSSPGVYESIRYCVAQFKPSANTTPQIDNGYGLIPDLLYTSGIYINHSQQPELKAEDFILTIQVKIRDAMAAGATDKNRFTLSADYPGALGGPYTDDKGFARTVGSEIYPTQQLDGFSFSKLQQFVNDGSKRVLSLPNHNPGEEWIYAEMISISPSVERISGGFSVQHLQ